MVLAWNFEEGGEGSSVGIDSVSYPLGNLHRHQYLHQVSETVLGAYMLVDQENANILPLSGESIKCFLDCGIVRLAVYNEKVLLGIWRGSDMLNRTSVYC